MDKSKPLEVLIFVDGEGSSILLMQYFNGACKDLVFTVSSNYTFGPAISTIFTADTTNPTKTKRIVHSQILTLQWDSKHQKLQSGWNAITPTILRFIFLHFSCIKLSSFRSMHKNNRLDLQMSAVCSITSYTSMKTGCWASLVGVLISAEISGQHDIPLLIGHSTFATPPSGRLLSATASRTNLQSRVSTCFHQVFLPDSIAD
jgi:hypothetical protein